MLHAGRYSGAMRFVLLRAASARGARVRRTIPPLASIPLPAGKRFSPTDAMRTGPHKYFIAEAYSGLRESVWEETK